MSSYVRRTCLDNNTLWSATFLGSEVHSFVLGATVIRFFNGIGMGAKVQGTDILLQGAKVPGNESSRERKYQGMNVPWNESSWERKFHVTFALGRESSRERMFQGAKVPESESSTYGTFALGSESTWERKFHNSQADTIFMTWNLIETSLLM